MRVCVLGTLEVEDGDGVISVGGPQARRVVARLALDAGRAVSVDALADAAWGDDQPATARHTIATHVLRLRRAGLLIDTVPDGYALRTPTDVADLERLASQARAEAKRDPRRAARAYLRAIGLWRGDSFPELADVADRVPVAARLDDQISTLREEWIAAELDAGDAAEWIGPSLELTAAHPYRERGWQLLMLALYRAGRQADALDAYATVRRRLIDDLGVEPGVGLRQMQLAVLAQDPSLAAANGESMAPTPRAAVPATSTRFIGRASEQHDLAEVWARARLATVIGPPGAGKTRLVLEAAGRMGGAVWYVAVEQVPLRQTVAAAVLDVVDPSSRAIDAAAGVRDALSQADGLLVLDGCEGRKLEVAGLVDELLRACPSVRVLTTSRVRLGLGDEATLRLGPLPHDDARSLLIDRARLVDPAFAVTAADTQVADRLCSLVDHLPLGIELVATHLHLLGVEEVVDRVEADLGRWVGRPPDGRGLWAALDSSVDERTPAERGVLLALAVMVGEADLDLIAAVAGVAEPEVFDSLAALVDASLVHVRSGGNRGRYELLRTVAVHTLEREPSADIAQARARYEQTVLERTAMLTIELASSDRRDAMQRLDLEMQHVRAVLGAIDTSAPDAHHTTAGLEIAVALSDYWLGRHPAEGADWIRRLIDVADASGELRAEARLLQGHLLYWLTDFDNAAATLETARSEFARIGDALGEGRALRRLGAIASATDDVVAARGLLEASLERLETTGVDAEVGTTLLHLGSLLADVDDVVPARAALERALSIAVAGGDPLAEGHALAGLTLADWKANDLRAARRCGERALARFRDLGHLPTEGTVAYRLAAITRGLGQPRVARRHAQTAIRAGEQSSTRTTVAFGHINLARLDLDAGDIAAARHNLETALDVLHPSTDRWVLVDALEVVARLAVAVGGTGAGQLLGDAAALRSEIRQPVSPTERADVDATRARAAAELRVGTGRTDAAAAHATALRCLYAADDRPDEPIPLREVTA